LQYKHVSKCTIAPGIATRVCDARGLALADAP